MLPPLPDGVSVSVMLLRRLPALSIVCASPLLDSKAVADEVRRLAGDEGLPRARVVVDVKGDAASVSLLAAHILADVRECAAGWML